MFASWPVAAIGTAAQPPRVLQVRGVRSAPSDLEIAGMLRGVSLGAFRYLRRADLLALPQTEAAVDDDPDLPGIILHIRGVALGALAQAIGVPPTSDLFDALCNDGYRSYYPADAIAAHHPILVLTIDGMSPAQWAAHAHQEDPGPYLIVYRHFVPSFRVLAHTDRPQLPTNVIRINFGSAAASLAAIAPRGQFGPNAPERQGFAIARQNCLRCHAAGPTGGTKSIRHWTDLAALARTRPAFFAAYIRDPNATDLKAAHATMPGNPDYDAPTLAALTAYFRTLSAQEPTPR